MIENGPEMIAREGMVYDWCHVGIVTDVDPEGHGFKFIHAARTGVIVSDSNSAYYSRRYLGARRIIAD